MRKIYQTPEHVRNENAVAKTLVDAWKVPARRKRRLNPQDWIVGGTQTEIKCRTEKWDPLNVSLRKWEELREAKGILVIRWPDGEVVWTRADRDWPRHLGGRTRKYRDPGDIEMMVSIPMTAFHSLAISPFPV